MFMNELGESCHPSTADICRYSGLDKKTVLKHIATAREAGWIGVSQHGYRGQKWKRQEYAARWPDRDLVAPCAPEDDGEGGGAVPPPSGTEKVVESTAEGGGTEGAKVVEHVHQDKTSPENIPNTSPVEKEGAGALDEKSSSEKAAPDETPGRADFQKRVARFCNGRGFVAGQWKNWDQVAFGWIADQFAKLNPEERAEAERWRDAYLLDCRERKTDPQGVGVFLRDKAWLAMEPILLERAEKQKQAQLAPQDRARPEGWAKFLGPVGMARLFVGLLQGQAEGLEVRQPFISDSALRSAWPFLWQFRAKLRQQPGAVFAERWHDMKGSMEPVPQGSEMLASWKQEFTDRGWLWLSEFDRIEVVFCPAGGPERLGEFEAAVRGTGNDGDRCEAAE